MGVKEAKEFVNWAEGLINSPNQRLVGDISTGYRMLDDEVELRNMLSSMIKEVLNDRFGVPKTRVVYIHNIPEIHKVIFNHPATVVLWSDGTKTVVKCGDYDIFDPEKGLAMAIAKKALGNKGNYYEEFKKWLPEFKLEVTESENNISEEVYEEKDTKCDLCDRQDGCTLLECTSSGDERVHYIPAIGNICKKERPNSLPYTVKEYCELHNCTKNKVYGMIKRGVVKAEKDSKGAWIIYE